MIVRRNREKKRSLFSLSSLAAQISAYTWTNASCQYFLQAKRIGVHPMNIHDAFPRVRKECVPSPPRCLLFVPWVRFDSSAFRSNSILLYLLISFLLFNKQKYYYVNNRFLSLMSSFNNSFFIPLLWFNNWFTLPDTNNIFPICIWLTHYPSFNL